MVEFEFPSNLDIVIAFASLIHVKKPELQDILDKIYTVLNENGLTYLSLKYSSSYKKITKEDDLGERTYYLYSKEDIYKDLIAEGQTINSINEGFSLLVTEYKKEDSKKRITTIMAVIGAILVGAGIFSFVAANWQEIGKFYKILIILCSMLSSYYGGWILKERYHRVKTGEALILLGSIIYGAGIFLIGQMFNIRANWPVGSIFSSSRPIFTVPLVPRLITLEGLTAPPVTLSRMVTLVAGLSPVGS